MGVLDAQGAALADTVLPLLNAYGKRLDRLDIVIDFDGGRVNDLQSFVSVIRRLTFGQRLRWLLTGRLP